MPDDVNVIPTFSFQLTPSRRATTLADVKNQIDGISTHALTEGDFLRFSSFSAHRISTHALTEGDRALHSMPGLQFISTHALTEGDSQPMDSRSSSRLFQLTPSRRATSKLPSGKTALYFNSRPHGGRRCSLCFSACIDYFNSRPHGGRRQI